MTFYFDLASPWVYLAAERAERMFADMRWQPVMGEALTGGRSAPDPRDEALRAAAERRAAELRLPLVWPDGWPGGARGAMRVSALAAEAGLAAPFVLAASRLAFCGGYDLDDPEILAEAAAAAGLGLDAALTAAGEHKRDAELVRTALALLRRGAEELPAISVDRLLFCGERRLAAAAAAVAGPPPSRRLTAQR